MSAVRFQCPTCQAPLRLENRAMFLGRTFACPDCSAMLLIEPRGHDGVSARITTAVTNAPQLGLKQSVPTKPTPIEKPATRSLAESPKVEAMQPTFGVYLQPRASIIDVLSRRPALLGWSVAILFAIVLFATINSSDGPPTPDIVPVVKANSQPVAPPTNADQSDRKTPTNSVSPDPTVADEHTNGTDQTPDKLPLPIESLKPENITTKTKPNADLKRTDPTAPKPGDDPTLPDNQPDVPKPDANNPAPKPIAEPVPDVPKKESVETIEARLKQKLARFDQTKPVQFIKLLDIFEDLAGVPIVWDLETVDDKQLQKTVTLKLQQTTVGETLDAVLKQVGLHKRIVEGRIELVPMTKLEN
ncbi:MAG: hypothetical protein NT013_07010 [Planctomycetia bacterium]|nr:hypothetical protein [Planctomycetia bacterium]